MVENGELSSIDVINELVSHGYLINQLIVVDGFSNGERKGCWMIMADIAKSWSMADNYSQTMNIIMADNDSQTWLAIQLPGN